jgi:hypothetical protein
MTLGRGGVLLLAAAIGMIGCVDPDTEVVLTPNGAAAAQSRCDEEPDTGWLRGNVYSLPLETRRLPDFAALRPTAAICTNALDVTERNGYPGFPGLGRRYEWFGVDFRGKFAVTRPGTFSFRLTSDDGAQLVIDGALVVDNDGYHATRARQVAVRLEAGTHSIAIPYWQGPGPMALILEVAAPGQAYDVFIAGRPLDGGST